MMTLPPVLPSVGNPQEWHLPSSPGGAKPVSSLCHSQQPPSQSELDWSGTDSDPNPVFKAGGAGAASGQEGT